MIASDAGCDNEFADSHHPNVSLGKLAAVTCSLKSTHHINSLWLSDAI